MIYDPEVYGTIADWFGIVATVLTIFFTLRHYANDNKIDFRIMCYSRNKYEEDNGVTKIKLERQLIITGVNFSKSPQLFRLAGFMKKETVFEKIKSTYKGEKTPLVPFDFEFIPHKLVEYELVNQNDKSKDHILSKNYVDNYLLENGLDINEGFYVVYTHISGKRFKTFLKAIA